MANMPPMVRHFRSIVSVLLCAASLCTVAAAETKPATAPAEPGKEYSIKLTRPAKVGTRYHYAADGVMTQQTTVTTAGERREPEADWGAIHLEGTVEVLEVDEDGEESKIACTVEKCREIGEEKDKELLPAGTVVIAQAGEKETSYSLKGKAADALPPETSELLDLVLSLPHRGDPTNDDELFGNDKPQKVGGTWPIQAGSMARSAASSGIEVKEKDVSGAMTLESVELHDGVECLKVTGQVEMKNITPPAPEDLEGVLKDRDGKVEARFSGMFPVYATKGSLAESMSMTVTSVMKGHVAGGDVQIETTVQRAIEMKRRFE